MASLFAFKKNIILHMIIKVNVIRGFYAGAPDAFLLDCAIWKMALLLYSAGKSSVHAVCVYVCEATRRAVLSNLISC